MRYLKRDKSQETAFIQDFKAILYSVEKSLEESDNLLVHSFNDKTSEHKMLEILEVVAVTYICYVRLLADLQFSVEEKHRKVNWPNPNMQRSNTSFKIAQVSVLVSYLEVSKLCLLDVVRIPVEKCFEGFADMVKQFRTLLVEIEKEAAQSTLLKPSYMLTGMYSNSQTAKPSVRLIQELRAKGRRPVALEHNEEEACNLIIKLFFDCRMIYDEIIERLEMNAYRHSDMRDKSEASLETPGLRSSFEKLKSELQNASKLLQVESQRWQWLLEAIVEVVIRIETLTRYLDGMNLSAGGLARCLDGMSQTTGGF